MTDMESSTNVIDGQSSPHGVRTGTQDGIGAGDHDVTYHFGRRPSANAPFPFTTRQFARLLVQRSRVRSGEINAEDREDGHPLVFLPDGIWIASNADLLVAVVDQRTR